MSEQVGFDGPIYMTMPTKVIAPILLEDFRKVVTKRQREDNFFTSEMIKQCMKKWTTCLQNVTLFAHTFRLQLLTFDWSVKKT